MPCFARPATWSYDLPLFREATEDEDRLESLLAAIATPGQGLWVVEENERPVAFAWTVVVPDRLEFQMLYLGQTPAPEVVLRELFRRVAEEPEAERPWRLEVDNVAGASPKALTSCGWQRDAYGEGMRSCPGASSPPVSSMPSIWTAASQSSRRRST